MLRRHQSSKPVNFFCEGHSPFALRPALPHDVHSDHGPSDASYFSILTMKSRSGSWHASAMPLIAYTWLIFSSVGSNVSRCRRTFFSALSSTTTFWYSAAAPPVFLSALLTFLINPAPQKSANAQGRMPWKPADL